jgi:phospholipid/cholesterol/gamma-HCH transport system permease protein
MMLSMKWLTSFITRRGAAALSLWRTWRGIFSFAGKVLVTAMSPKAYNSATRMVVIKQIYFTAWQILLPFTLFSALLSFVLITIVVEQANTYGFGNLALELSVRVLVLEILPLLTALFIALRSSTAINTEIALMRIHNELDALEAVGVDTMRLEFMPRVIAGIVSVLALTALTSTLALVLAYLAVYGFQVWSIPEFNLIMGKVFSGSVLLVLWLKCLAFGLAISVIPLAAGLNTPKMLFMAPISVLQGMVRLFFVLMLIEVASLALIYI